MSRTIKVTLSDEAAFYMDFLVDDETLKYPRVLFERLIMGAIKKRKVDDRPVYNPDIMTGYNKRAYQPGVTYAGIPAGPGSGGTMSGRREK